MGERKGQNFYYPPDFDPKIHGSLNGYHGVHALRERARKMDRGILIIRFEMPYNIWCGGCKKHIGMGVRYNAEKTKIGMYYTTPVYQFRMKCHLCTNHFSIKTDPANLDYVIVDGASRQERRWDPTENGQVVPDDKAVGRKLADDAMYKLEHEKTDKGKSADAGPRIMHITDIQDRVKDDYLANRILRDKFRRKKKQILEKKEKNEALLKKASLDTTMDLVDECPEDVKYAQLLSLQARRDAEDVAEEGLDNVKHQDIFQPASSKEKGKIKPSKEAPIQIEKSAREIIIKAANSESSKLLKNGGFGSPTALLALPGASKTTSIRDLGIVRKKPPTSISISSNTSSINKKNNGSYLNNGTSNTNKQLVNSTKSIEIIENTKNLQNDEVQPEEKTSSSSLINSCSPLPMLSNSCNPLQMLSNYSDSSEDDSS